MSFSWFYSKKVGFAKTDRRNTSPFIIKLGQVAVAIGIIVSLLTVSIGIGAKKMIKQKLSDFNGHITLKSYESNGSFNSVSIDTTETKTTPILTNSHVASLQFVATKSGVIRTERDFEGVVYKGYDYKYDKERLGAFVREGRLPVVYKDSLSFEVALSQKIAKNLKLKINDSFVMYFMDEETSKPIYRKYKLVGIYATDIADFDNAFVIGDIKQVQKLNHWSQAEVGGAEIFVDDIENLDAIYENIEPIISMRIQAEKATTTYANIADWIKLFDNNIYVILFLMLGVVAINMSMIFLLLVLEKTQSIGLLKVLGTQHFEIVKIFIFQSLFIMIPGLVVGNGVALSFLFLQKYFKLIKLPAENYYLDSVPVYLDIWYILLINLVAIIISSVVLLIPSFIIAKISPIKAIRFQ